jgi:hypothetical protein
MRVPIERLIRFVCVDEDEEDLRRLALNILNEYVNDMKFESSLIVSRCCEKLRDVEGRSDEEMVEISKFIEALEI